AAPDPVPDRDQHLAREPVDALTLGRVDGRPDPGRALPVRAVGLRRLHGPDVPGSAALRPDLGRRPHGVRRPAPPERRRGVEARCPRRRGRRRRLAGGRDLGQPQPRLPPDPQWRGADRHAQEPLVAHARRPDDRLGRVRRGIGVFRRGQGEDRRQARPRVLHGGRERARGRGQVARRAAAPATRRPHGRRRSGDRRPGRPAGRPSRRVRADRQAHPHGPRDGGRARPHAAGPCRRFAGRGGRRARLTGTSRPLAHTRFTRRMTTESRPRFKITYATLRNDNDELHAAFEAGLEEAKRELGGHHRNFIDGLEREAQAETTVASPIDRDLILGHFAKGSRSDVQEAVDAARRAQPAWAATPWRDRLALIRKAAELISERQMRYAGLMAIEVGKNRLEALGEVEEAADLLRYYSQTMEDNGGYDHPMDNLGDGAVHTRSILRPHGVFAVISPFNFPMALAAGPTAAALIAGNTVVFKPSTAAPMSGVKLIEAYRDAGLPDGVVNLVMGPGETVGQELRENPGIDGIVFTGSYDVGMDLFRTFSKGYPKPTIVEMGGKNPAVVSRK